MHTGVVFFSGNVQPSVKWMVIPPSGNPAADSIPQLECASSSMQISSSSVPTLVIQRHQRQPVPADDEIQLSDVVDQAADKRDSVVDRSGERSVVEIQSQPTVDVIIDTATCTDSTPIKRSESSCKVETVGHVPVISFESRSTTHRANSSSETAKTGRNPPPQTGNTSTHQEHMPSSQLAARKTSFLVSYTCSTI